jgi:UDP-N-acetylmuramoyl-L-alanyl-D-glutamate--2,6-diaminopimelate ligase
MIARPAVALRSLLEAIPGAALHGDPETEIAGIAYDSRLVAPGDLFAALPGADADGHEFAAESETRGAAALLLERRVPSSLPCITAPDSRAALSAVSARFHGDPSRELSVIGITGTDGKTTTSYLVDHLLRSAGSVTGMVGTVAVRIANKEDIHSTRQTTPESSDIQCYLRRMVDADADYAILEATSHGLAMHRLDHVGFRVGAVTNITHEHLDFHGSVEDYRRAKAMLLERVAAAGGVAVINADDAGARAIIPYAVGAEIMTFSASGADAALRAIAVRRTATGSRFTLDAGRHGQAEIDLPMLGQFNVANALCAAGIAIAAGMELQVIAAALATAPPVPGRMHAVRCGQPFTVIVDYAHTPDSLEKVLRLLREAHPDGRLIAVFGSAGERDREKRPRQGAIAARLADISVVTSEDPRFEDADAIIEQIAAGARSAGAEPGETLHLVTDRRGAIQLAIDLACPGDCVLLAGKGHEGSIIWGREKVPWNEADVVRELLAATGFGSA